MKNIIGLLNLYDSPELGPLTENRTLASTSFLGRYAIMDFALSNFTNSGIDDFSILVKNNFRSVTKHVHTMKAWVSNTKIGKQYLLINANGIRDKSLNNDINNIKTNDWIFYESDAQYIVVQPAHIISQINLRKVVKAHIASGADVTLVYTKITNGKSTFKKHLIPELDEKGKVISLRKNNGDVARINVSLDTYVISREVMKKILNARGNNRATSLRQALIKGVEDFSLNVQSYYYEGYVRCFDSFKAFCDISFELLNYENAKQLFDTGWTAYTNTHNTPPAKYGENACVKNTYVANGAVIDGTVENSIVSRNVVIEKGAVVKNSIILTGTKVSECAIIENAVIDKWAFISTGATVKAPKSRPTYVRQGKIVK